MKVVYNNKIFKEDPLHKLHFEDINDNSDIVLHLGYDHINLSRFNDKEKHVLIEFEQPNRFLHPTSHGSTFICENFFDKILTINPEFVINRNKILGKQLYEHIFFPYNLRYVADNIVKTNDVIYTGNKDYFGICDSLKNFSVVWVGNNGTVKNISHDEKIALTRKSKISISHSVVEFKDLTDFMDKHSETVSHINGVFEQHKARTIEAAFNKTIIIHVDTGQKLIEEFFTEGEDFLYYKEGLVEEILSDYENYVYLADNAFKKAMDNYTTEHFYNKYIKPLV